MEWSFFVSCLIIGIHRDFLELIYAIIIVIILLIKNVSYWIYRPYPTSPKPEKLTEKKYTTHFHKINRRQKKKTRNEKQVRTL